MSEQQAEFHTPDRPPFWHTMTTTPETEVISGLIDRLQNGRSNFSTAADGVDNPNTQERLQELSELYRGFQAVLIEHLIRLGSEPEDGRSVMDMLEETWLKAQSKMGATDQSLVEKCVSELKETENAYMDARQFGLSESLFQTIQKQQQQILQNREQLELLVQKV